MKNSFIISVFTLIFLALSGMDIQAQPTAHFGCNTIYKYWPVLSSDCDLNLGITSAYPQEENIVSTNAFQYNHEEANTPCTIYGVAAGVAPANGHNVYTLQGSTWSVDGTIEIFLYKATEGDSAVELVKTSRHVVHAGKAPDRVLVIRDSLSGRLSQVEQYLHEFYFDEPITVSGLFLVGMVGSDFGLSLSFFHTHYPCYQYYPPVLLDMKNQKVLQINGMRGNIIPDVDSVKLWTDGHMYYPILVPEGSAIGTGQVQEDADLRLVPNPARTEVRVETGCAVREVVVTDMVGRTVLHRDCHGGELGVNLDVSRLPQGCYTVRVSTDRGVLTEKLIVE